MKTEKEIKDELTKIKANYEEIFKYRNQAYQRGENTEGYDDALDNMDPKISALEWVLN